MPQLATGPISTEPSHASFGEWLKRQRKLRDLTQDELARQVGCARVTIRKFESDEMRPSKQLAELLAQALAIPAAERAAFVQFARGAQATAEQSAPHATDARPTNNLPVQPTSFIGREREVAEVKRLLATTQLLTLTGSGGTGKTRLSLQVAAELLGSFQNGVWLVELAPLTDPAMMVMSVASVLGVSREQDRPVLTTLLDWLRDKQLLLILDNCEHLIDACAQFADAVVRATRGTRILASSREALGIAGETVYRVPSLGFPNPAEMGQMSNGQLMQFEAVQLFAERAFKSQTGFSITNTNTRVVAHICSRLEGIPLAIELAAARVRVMSVEQIANRLDDRFRLLTGGSRTALARQQTLRGMIDWSHGLLTEAERILLRRLSVFAGSWTLEAVEAVCTGKGIEPYDVLDILTHLVDKSLVVPDEQSHETRYRMLETIRQYAREKLLDAGEGEQLRDQHLRFFLKLAEQVEPILRHAHPVDVVARLERDHDNLNAALEWACERDPETARWLAGLLVLFWLFGDHMNEAHAWYERVLALSDSGARTKGLALALFGAGFNSAILYLLDDARSYLEQSVVIWRILGDQTRLAAAIERLAYALMMHGQYERACARLEAHETLLRQFAEPVVLAMALTTWGRALANSGGDAHAAKALLDEGLSIGMRYKNPTAIGTTFTNLGHWAALLGDYETAKLYHLDALAWRRQEGSRWGTASALFNVAALAYLQGDHPQARFLFLETLELYRAAGHQLFVARVLSHIGRLELHQGDLTQAVGHLAESQMIFRERSNASGIASCLVGFAQLSHLQGRAEEAVRLLATQSLVTSIQGANYMIDRLEYKRTLAAARAQLDPAAFAAAWEAGRQLTLDQAVALAVEAA